MKKVLIIEDDTVLRENTAELLQLSNYKTLTASNGQKGVEMAIQHLPDVILCDIMMPEMNGYSVLNSLLQEKTTKHIPFIFLSAKTERKDIRKGMDLGADDYLPKPFEESELIGAIESRLARVAILAASSKNKTTTTFEFDSIKTIHELKNYIDDSGNETEHEQGTIIYREGSNSSMVYLILKGAVKTYKLDELGKELITAIYKPDDFFGFTDFTKNLPHHEFATAIEHTRLVGVAKRDLKTILASNNHLALEFMQLMAENLSEAKDQLLHMAYATVRRKTASTLLKFDEKLGANEKERLHILRSDLASVAGMATETLIRTLSNFKKEGLIRVKDRNIQLLDIEGLKKVH